MAGPIGLRAIEPEDLAIPVAEDPAPFSESESIEEDLSLLAKGYWLAGSARRALAVGAYDLSYELAVEAESYVEEEDAAFENSLVVLDSLLATTQWVEARARLLELAGEYSEGQALERIALREAMMAYAEGDDAGVMTNLADVSMESLQGGEGAWYWFLLGWGDLSAGNFDDSQKHFAEARKAAYGTSPALSSQIGYLIFRSLLDSSAASVATIPQLQSALLENEGREIWFVYAQQLAALLYDSGDREAAIDLISRSLMEIPEGMGLEKAQFQLLATMAAGLERSEGRQALTELISANDFPDLMSIALQQAFSQARTEGAGTQDIIRQTLDQMIGASREHLLLDQALYYRAVFRFLDDDFVEAEEDAAELQRRFPRSPYRRGMLALQASSSWNRERYRTAASRLQQMRTEYADLRADYRLSSLIADCYLHAGLHSNTRDDFRNAAEAYATALANVTSLGQGGRLFFQLIYSRLKAGQLDLAIEAVDDDRLRSLAESEMIWQAQWLVLREMRRQGRGSEAYDRAQEAVLSESTTRLLKLRLLWLTARLSVVSGDPEYTIDWVREIESFVDGEIWTEEEEDLLGKVLASSQLSLSEAYFALGEPEEAVEILKELRTEYPGKEASLLSFISEARYLTKINRTVEAQQLLVSLADRYSEHRLAPLALFEAALNAEQRGQDAYLDEATKLLQRIATDYPDSDIVFRARLMQADLLRRLNKFSSAEQIYYRLENEYSDRPDRFLAQMSMAETLLAQADRNPVKFDGAISRFEHLADLPEAPLDLRIEAGFKLGQVRRSRGEALRAKQIFWVLYDKMLVEELRIRELNAKGRYWLARALFSLAELSGEEGDIDKANLFYREIIKHGLNGAELARDRLQLLETSVGASLAN
ncbi:tetratricopeptide repeat protein [Pelagicoccus albus]|uniref:Tetratricopeptide repeat protein n=1 Tax=Pelagicoccus albus TaxID=415222 RepID=A0A7X1E8M1_9BACT|nr:tetratricopeptide repeat protein [Pelagicoccus albus]MBC2606426.1 tetratricopeptide repeat protein [Pelagicoccus albus]